MKKNPPLDRIGEPWGARTPYDREGEWPVRVDECYAEGVSPERVQRWVPTASLLHSNGDAMDIAVIDDQIAGVRGRASDRVNHGRLDVKDLYAWQANRAADRLTTPLIRRGGTLVPADWGSAMGAVAGRSRELLEQHGPGSLGFYTTGQFFAEEYYTLATIARAGIGTGHLDGNTRLCTATAGEALKETFGSDGQPASYTDVDHAEVIALFGHNVAETQPVLWMRMLDRLDGPRPPRLLVVDPRRTPTADRAAVHLAARPGTNLALMNALLHELIAHDWVDHAWLERHTVGFEELASQVADCTPKWAADICGIDASDIVRAAEMVGTTGRLLATVLQGFYQSHQATAAAVQVNNLVLLRGMLGRPGCGVLQMNGQPTAQNTRECGANGDLPGFRNWENAEHVTQLAEIWNVAPAQIPHYAPPTHAMQMFRYAEQGSIKFLWISGTNPAVSLPELARIRSILADDGLFVVVQDIFLTETAALADVVLPAATWGEKTGVFTNADRTVHLSEKAVDPPGQARSDLDIFLHYASLMGFTDKDGQPLISWTDPESAFSAWKRCSAGRPCDYTGLTYDLLRQQGGIQWPCTAQAPGGTERLYTDGRFWAAPGECESYGRDLVTGAAVEETEYRALNPAGKAVLKAAEYLAPHEDVSDDYPTQLITGRTIYHFHTRTKTARAPELQAAAPEVWAEISAEDARRLGISVGTLLDITSPRGQIRAAARIRDIRPGVVFVPFHYGYWDTPRPVRSRPRRPGYSRQRTHHDRLGPGLQAASSQAVHLPHHGGLPRCGEPPVTGQAGLRYALTRVHHSENKVAEHLREIADRHSSDHEIHHVGRDLAGWSQRNLDQIAAAAAGHDIHLNRDASPSDSPGHLHRALPTLAGHRPEPGLRLLEDLRDLYLLASESSLAWEMLAQYAKAGHAGDITELASRCHPQTLRQIRWSNTMLKTQTPQVLTSL